MQLAARIGTMAANGTNIKTIVYDGDTITNMQQFKEWAVGKLGSAHWFLIAKSLVSPNTDYQVHGGMLDYTTMCLRYHNGLSSTASWSTSFLAHVSDGDEFYCIQNPQYTDSGAGGGDDIRCIIRSSRLYLRSSARFCEHYSELEVAA